MNAADVCPGLLVLVACGPSTLGPRYRRGKVIDATGSGCYQWRVEFPSGAVSILTAAEMEPVDAVTQLAAVIEP